jgi:hypothetical protein
LQLGALKKDPTPWLDGARPPPRYVIAQYNTTVSQLAIYFARKYTKCTCWIQFKKYISKYIKIGRICSMLGLFLLLAVQLSGFQKESCSMSRWSYTTNLSILSPNPTTPFVDLPFLSGIHPMYKVDSSTKQYISNYVKNSKIGFMFRSFYS